jgi:hypothetical protein
MLFQEVNEAHVGSEFKSSYEKKDITLCLACSLKEQGALSQSQFPVSERHHNGRYHLAVPFRDYSIT